MHVAPELAPQKYTVSRHTVVAVMMVVVAVMLCIPAYPMSALRCFFNVPDSIVKLVAVDKAGEGNTREGGKGPVPSSMVSTDEFLPLG